MSSELSSVVESHFSGDAGGGTSAPAAGGTTSAPTKPDTAGGAAAATGQTASPPAPDRPYYFKAKVDREERDVDLAADWPDETKRKAHIDIYQRGLGHEPVLARARGESLAAGQKAVLEILSKQGYTWKQDAAAPGGWRFSAPAATPEPGAADSPIAKEIAELQDKVEKDTATAGEIVKLGRLERQRDNEKATAAETRRAQEAQAADTKTRHERSVDDALVDAVGARAKSFEGVPEDVANGVRAIAFALAKKTALATGATPEAAAANVAVLLDKIEAAVEAMVKHRTKPPAPSTAPPVHGGTPAGNAKPTKFNDIKELVESHFSGS